MGVITLSIDDELERQVRERISQMGGFSKGALSRVFEEAVRLWLLGRSPALEGEEDRRFRAMRGGKVIAEARTLRELAEELKAAKVDPRDVQILSSVQRPGARRLGMRTVGRRAIRGGRA